MQESFAVLEIEKILGLVANYAKTEDGKVAILGSRPYREGEFKSALSFAFAWNEVSPLLGTLTFGDGRPLKAALTKAAKGARMNEEELLSFASYSASASETKVRLENIEVSNVVTDFIQALPDTSFIESRIREVIAPDQHIYDNASPKLKAIRRDIKKKEKEANAVLPTLIRRYEPYLNATSLAYKDGHYTLPVSISYKHKVHGLVIDFSQSENTVFIEPDELLNLQNEIAELRAQEREEILELLKELSALIEKNQDACLRLYDDLVFLDIVQAKDLFGLATHGHLAEISDDGSLYLQAARHPLLDPSKVVANDFRLNADSRVVVLSGPNAGGKTVALKTLAVNILLFEMAIPCLAEQGGTIPYFKHVYCDIGDSQSIEENLSTFSGHMANIASIAEHAGGKDIVFLDEVGTGTSPKEGEALAIAILQYLERKHAYVLVSSHFEGLKALALENPRFDNASLIYDEEGFRPTYRLRFGSPGESYGLLAAKRFGLQPEILEMAKKRLSAHGEGSVAFAIKKLTKLQKENEALAASLKQKEEELKQERSRLKVEANNLKRSKERFQEDLEAEKEAVLAKAKEEVAELIKDLSKPDIKLHEAIALKKRLDSLGQESSIEEERREPGSFKLGDYVEIGDYGIAGRITRIQGKRVTVATSGGKDYQTDLSSLTLSEDASPKEEVLQGAFLDQVGTSSVGLECNLIGMRVEEAKAELDRYLDRCRLSGFNRVRIIHGFGSGALRAMTHEYLKAHKGFVASFERAGPQEGGSGATVVYLK